MQEGLVFKAYGGFYYVLDQDEVWECRIRGKFKNQRKNIFVGDKVKFASLNEAEHKGVIEDILERKNFLIRPPIANVDLTVIVMSMYNPEPNLMLLDRFLILAKYSLLEPVVCFNKSDLGEPANLKSLVNIYKNAGFQVMATSAKEKAGIEQLAEMLQNKISVFAGPSGVGKSSLLNALKPGIELKVGQVSEKIKRGKHTTRHVELISINKNTFVADTPGFTNLDLPDLEKNRLLYYYPELEEYNFKCKFNTCIHLNEPGCLVKNAVEQGDICNERYASYVYFLKELQEKGRKY